MLKRLDAWLRKRSDIEIGLITAAMIVVPAITVGIVCHYVIN